MKISHSAKNTYVECARKYYLHYMLKLRPTSLKSSLVYGGVVDEGLNHLLSTKDLPGALAAFDSKWDSFKTQAIDYSKADYDDSLLTEEEQLLPEATWLSLKYKGRILIEEFNAQVIPKIKEVVAIQIPIAAENDMGDTLVGFADFICVWEDGRRLLVDNKTSSVKYAEDSVATSEQLGIYFEQLKDTYNLDACAYIVLPKRINRKKTPRIEIKVIIDNVRETVVEATLQQYDSALAGIKDVQFEKNPKECVGKFGKCVYYAYCRSGDRSGLKEKE